MHRVLSLRFKVFSCFMFLLCISAIAYPQATQITTAGLEIANTFHQLNSFMLGIQIGNVTLLPGAGNYSLSMPDTQPVPGSILGNDPITAGKLAFLPSCANGGFSPAGDLGGNGSSQQVVGIASIPIDLTVQPTDGMTLKYNAAKNKWVPSL